MDSSVSPTYGRQQGSAYNGHFACSCYHPLFLFNQIGDRGAGDSPAGQPRQCHVLAAGVAAGDRPLPGPGHPQVLPRGLGLRLPEVVRVAGAGRVPVRHPAEVETPVLERKIALLDDSPGGAAVAHAQGLLPQLPLPGRVVGSRARRVVVKIAWHAGELFPRVGFVVTNLKWRARRVVRFYNQRGTAEQWIKEGQERRERGRSCRAGGSGTTPPETAGVRPGVQPGQRSSGGWCSRSRSGAGR